MVPDAECCRVLPLPGVTWCCLLLPGAAECCQLLPAAEAIGNPRAARRRGNSYARVQTFFCELTTRRFANLGARLRHSVAAKPHPTDFKPAKTSLTMGHLSTHVLDTAHGCPAAGMAVVLQRLDAQGQAQEIKRLRLNNDGRADAPLLDAAAMAIGRYRLLFEVAPYFRDRGVVLPDPAFLDTVLLDFGISDAQGHYHVPLLVSPFSYSTYRGS